MSRALPVLASNVGGLPELVDERWLFPKGDSNAIADGIECIMQGAAKAAADNFHRAKEFDSCLLMSRKKPFYEDFNTFVERTLHE